MGDNIKLETDFYQPLDAAQEYFINPYFSYQRYNLNLFNDDNEENASFRTSRANIGLEVGRNLERWGRLSLGLRYGTGKNELRFGQIATDANTINEDSFDDGGYSIRWTADTLDNLNFPTSGYYGDLVFYDSQTALGASNHFSTLSLNAAKTYTWGKQTLIPRVILSGRLSGDLGIQDRFLLGGFLNLSGYQVGQISGQYAALGELIYMYRLDNASAAFTLPLYAGGSLEVGGAWDETDDITFDSLIPAGSLFLGADTPLGPFYLAGGLAKGDASLYLMLGRLF
ncbi:MAG TPA: hypothetical protein DCS21_09615 [Gammaproteobacteria bacterium]|nr:hypothetical protein [Gammaproteobacteria bacterium]